MSSSVRPLLGILLLSLAFLALAGCIQPAETSRCSNFANTADYNGCLRYFAVWDQQPYLCYSINDNDLRTSCLEDSNNPAQSEALKAAQASGLPTSTPSSPEVPITPSPSVNGTASPTYTNGSVDSLISQCMGNTAASQDSCMRQVGIDTLNLTLCSQIVAGDFRASCISNVALTLKQPSACDMLNRTADKQICTYYSSG